MGRYHEGQLPHEYETEDGRMRWTLVEVSGWVDVSADGSEYVATLETAIRDPELREAAKDLLVDMERAAEGA